MLHDNSIGAAGAKALAEQGFASVPELSYLDISFNPLGYEGIQALAARLQILGQLTHLNLRNTRTADEGAKALAERG
eukprot:12540551-Prorocentrum_lima.AAC.1